MLITDLRILNSNYKNTLNSKVKYITVDKRKETVVLKLRQQDANNYVGYKLNPDSAFVIILISAFISILIFIGIPTIIITVVIRNKKNNSNL